MNFQEENKIAVLLKSGSLETLSPVITALNAKNVARKGRLTIRSMGTNEAHIQNLLFNIRQRTVRPAEQFGQSTLCFRFFKFLFYLWKLVKHRYLHKTFYQNYFTTNLLKSLYPHSIFSTQFGGNKTNFCALKRLFAQNTQNIQKNFYLWHFRKQEKTRENKRKRELSKM